MQDYPALKLANLDANTVKLKNAFLEHDILEPFAFGAAQVSLRPCQETLAVENPITLMFSVNGALWNLTLGEPRYLLAHPMFAREEASGFTPQMLPPELRTAVSEVLFAPLAKRLSEHLGATVLFEDIQTAKSEVAGTAVSWIVTLEAAHMEPLCFQANLSTRARASVSMLLGLLKALPRNTKSNPKFETTLAAIPLRFDVVGGTLAIEASLLEGLAAGDVLLPQTWHPQNQQVALRLMLGTQCEETLCEVSDKVATLSSPFTPISESTMTDTKALEVKLSFVLENRLITLGELQSMTAGYAFTLTSDPNTPVTICANDKPIARGKLVDINGAVGVQVTETL